MRRLSDYDYSLPEAQIAQSPPEVRGSSRLLDLSGTAAADRRFSELVELLPAEAVLVVNDTRVLPARLRAHKDSGGAVELLALEPVSGDMADRCWRFMARASKPVRAGTRLRIDGTDRVLEVSEGRCGADGTIVAELDGPLLPLLQEHGEMPLPPYISRPGGATAEDRERYQTVYSKRIGAVAAPTAGLHLTPDLLAAVERRGIDVCRLTLHVGLGTFAPIRATEIDDHVMHTERYEVPVETAEAVASGRPVVAVGTTVVRALEAAAEGGRRLRSGAGETALFIRPGFQFRVVDQLVTNFHLPQSTLLMLVCAFGGYERVMGAYRHAVAAGYRFFSYGDAMLLSGPDR